MTDDNRPEKALLPQTPEPMPKWMDRTVFLEGMQKFSLQDKEKYVPYFEKRYPDLTKEQKDVAAQVLSRMLYICLTMAKYKDLTDLQLANQIPDIDVLAVTEPKLELNGKLVDTIVDVPDDQLGNLVFLGTKTFWNTQSIVQDTLKATADNDLQPLFKLYEVTAVEEMAHVAYLEWSSHDPEQWTQLMQELKDLNQKVRVDSEFVTPANYQDFFAYIDSRMEKHGAKWVDSYTNTFYPKPDQGQT